MVTAGLQECFTFTKMVRVGLAINLRGKRLPLGPESDP
jgi:hypothetical protein